MKPKNGHKILVVDDEEDLLEILGFNLRTEGYEVETATSAEKALEMELTDFDLILLDVMMGGMSGFQMAYKLKEDPKTEKIPIIFLTAKDSEEDTVTGLSLGADDYISKPFSIREVLLRVAAVLHRTSEDSPSRLSYKGLVLNMDNKTVTVDGKDVPFTKTEFGILALLIGSKGRLFSREQIISSIWPQDVLVLDRTVDVNITRLRKKIGPYADHIVTRSGFGYYFEA